MVMPSNGEHHRAGKNGTAKHHDIEREIRVALGVIARRHLMDFCGRVSVRQQPFWAKATTKEVGPGTPALKRRAMTQPFSPAAETRQSLI